MNDQTRTALDHLRTVEVAGRWVQPTDNDMYFTLGHLLRPDDYASVYYHCDFLDSFVPSGWQVTLYGPNEKLPELYASDIEAKQAAEAVLVTRGVVLTDPT